ncbi:hypothetical protein niasHT_001343 [Heterodera trifolii]|uniref:Ground-like domain-containing protein n=1 Tax=Heterodera trifolii TaxID=157864 RepID=A0ABD2LMX3_9BILA
MGKCQNVRTNNGNARVLGGNGQKFFVIQRDTNALDGSASQVQSSGMGGNLAQNMMQPQQQQFSQNFATPPQAQQTQQGFVALQQPQTFIPQQNRMPMPNQQQFTNQGMTNQRQTDLPPMMAPPQLGGQNAQPQKETEMAFSDEAPPCPQPTWKEAMEKAITKNPNESTNKVQTALSRAVRGTFIVACSPADRREAFQKKMKLSATGDNFCHVIKDGIWCQAVAMNMGGKGISIGMGRR